jgi:hypothetical protein
VIGSWAEPISFFGGGGAEEEHEDRLSKYCFVRQWNLACSALPTEAPL